MRVPFGAVPGFSLQADISEIAYYYRVRAKALRDLSRIDLSDDELEAADALVWRLIEQRRAKPGLVAEWLGTDIETVRASVMAHEARIKAALKRGIPASELSS